MIRLNLDRENGAPKKILCLGAHSDDIEIGCGATLLRITGELPGCEVMWVVFSGSEVRAAEARASAEAFLQGVERRQIIIKSFRDGFFPFIGGEIKPFFEQLKREFAPDLIFTHHRRDLHQDHRTLAELTWNTFRSHLILEYEISKYDGDLGAPNVFVPLEKGLCERKIQLILENFISQKDRTWFDAETFWALLRLRGLEADSPSRYAEAFYGRKMVL